MQLPLIKNDKSLLDGAVQSRTITLSSKLFVQCISLECQLRHFLLITVMYYEVYRLIKETNL